MKDYVDSIEHHGMERLIGKIITTTEKVKVLESRGWYRNACGGWTHPHGMDFLSFWEILQLSPAQLEYKLQYGSQAALPENFQKK